MKKKWRHLQQLLQQIFIFKTTAEEIDLLVYIYLDLLKAHLR